MRYNKQLLVVVVITENFFKQLQNITLRNSVQCFCFLLWRFHCLQEYCTFSVGHAVKEDPW